MRFTPHTPEFVSLPTMVIYLVLPLSLPPPSPYAVRLLCISSRVTTIDSSCQVPAPNAGTFPISTSPPYGTCRVRSSARSCLPMTVVLINEAIANSTLLCHSATTQAHQRYVRSLGPHGR